MKRGRQEGAEANQGNVKKPKAIDLPTQDEQKQLQQMEILMKNNLLNLQCKELLDEMREKSEALVNSKKLKDFLATLESDIRTTSTKHGCHGREITFMWTKKQTYSGLDEPISLDDEFVPPSIVYESPSLVKIIGSYTNQTMTSPFYNIDISVQIPDSIISSRDILDFAYFNKRKLYLAGLRKTLEMCNAKVHGNQAYKLFEVFYFKSDDRKPILCLRPAFTDGIMIRIFPTLSEESIKVVQLRNEKNNVRPAHWKADLKNKKEKDLDLTLLSPTPFYNMAILEDVVIPLHHEIISRITKNFPSLTESITLFKIWAAQRDLRFSSDGFDGHHTSLLVAYLLQTKLIQPQMSADIIFKGILTFLSATNLEKNVLDFSSNELTNVDAFSDRDYFPFNFVHPVKSSSSSTLVRYNIFWRISRSMMSHLQLEAQKSLNELHSFQSNATSQNLTTPLKSANSNLSLFEHLFLERRPFFSVYDCFYHLTVDSKWSSYFNDTKMPPSDYEEMKQSSLHIPVPVFFSEKVKSIVERALGNRIIVGNCFTHFQGADNGENANTKKSIKNYSIVPCSSSESSPTFIISFGYLVHKENFGRKVEKGPALVNEEDFDKYQNYLSELSAFKKFWGDKSELRRFKDGSIVESVVWEPNVSNQQVSNPYGIIDEVMKYILQLHLPLDACDISTIAPVYHLTTQISFHQEILSDSSSDLQTPQKLLTGMSRNQLYLQLTQSFDELKGIIINQLKNVPLAIDNLLPVSAEFRQTSFLLPQKHPFLQYQFVKENLENSNFVRDNIRGKFLRDYNGKVLPSNVSPLLVFCKFESSSKWPKDGVAIQKCKSAFMLKVKHELKKQFDIESILHENALDVVFNGYLFRLIPFASIENERIVLLSQEIAHHAGDNISEQGSTISDYIVPLANRNWIIPSAHQNSIKAIQLEFPIYGETVQLFTFWLGKHQLSGQLAHEILEILTAEEFLYPTSFQAPTTPLIAFYRTLQRFVRHNWEENPYILDLNLTEKEISTEIRNKIYLQFRSNRAFQESEKQKAQGTNEIMLNYLSPIMYIVTSNDKINNYMPTFIDRKQIPERMVFNLMHHYAQLTIQKLSRYLESESLDFIEFHHLTNVSEEIPVVTNFQKANTMLKFYESLFSSSSIFSHCQLLFEFHDSFIVKNSVAENKLPVSAYHYSFPLVSQIEVYKNISIQDLSVERLLALDNRFPMSSVQNKVLEKLQSVFENHALFFWNEFDGKTLGVLFRPSFLENASFNILNTQFRAAKAAGKGKKEKDEASVEPNWDEIINQIVEISNHLLILSKKNY